MQLKVNLNRKQLAALVYALREGYDNASWDKHYATAQELSTLENSVIYQAKQHGIDANEINKEVLNALSKS